MSDNSNNRGGIGILGLLGVVFVTLKLTGYINWSWWYVTLPFWLGFAVVCLFMLIAAVIIMFEGGIK